MDTWGSYTFPLSFTFPSPCYWIWQSKSSHHMRMYLLEYVNRVHSFLCGLCDTGRLLPESLENWLQAPSTSHRLNMEELWEATNKSAERRQVGEEGEGRWGRGERSGGEGERWGGGGQEASWMTSCIAPPSAVFTTRVHTLPLASCMHSLSPNHPVLIIPSKEGDFSFFF